MNSPEEPKEDGQGKVLKENPDDQGRFAISEGHWVEEQDGSLSFLPVADFHDEEFNEEDLYLSSEDEFKYEEEDDIPSPLTSSSPSLSPSPEDEEAPPPASPLPNIPPAPKPQSFSSHASSLFRPRRPPCCRRKYLPFMKYYFPIASWLPRYSFHHLPQDLLAGLAVATLLIPQSIAYAIIAHLPPNMGLWAGIVPCFMYVIFGTCPQLAVGPEGVVSMLLAELVVELEKEICGGGGHGEGNSKSGEFGVTALCGAHNYPLVQERVVGSMYALSFLCGILCLGLGLMRAGFFANIISKSILNGFVTASALIILGSQLDEFFGFNCSEQTLGEGIAETTDMMMTNSTGSPFPSPAPYCDPICLEHGGEGLETYLKVMQKLTNGCMNFPSLILGCLSIVLFFLLEFTKKVLAPAYPLVSLFPTTFCIIILGIFAGYFGDLDDCCSVRLLGEVSSGPPPLSRPHLPSTLGDLKLLLSLTVTIVLIGFVEATAVAKTYGNKHQYSVSPNRELIAFGATNFVGAFFSAYPVFSSLPRSNVADLAGARTTLTGLVAALLTLICVCFFMPVFQYLPYSVVSGVIMCAAALLVEVEDVVELVKLHAWKEVSLALLVFGATFVLGPSYGIAVTLGVSIYFVVKRSNSLSIQLLAEDGGLLPNDQVPEQNTRRVIILQINEPIHFGNASRLTDMLRRVYLFGAPKIHPGAVPLRVPLRGLIIDMGGVKGIDPEGLSVFKGILEELKSRETQVFFVDVDIDVLDFMVRGGLIGGEQEDEAQGEEGVYPPKNLFRTVDGAVAGIDRLLRKLSAEEMGDFSFLEDDWIDESGRSRSQISIEGSSRGSIRGEGLGRVESGLMKMQLGGRRDSGLERKGSGLERKGSGLEKREGGLERKESGLGRKESGLVEEEREMEEFVSEVGEEEVVVEEEEREGNLEEENEGVEEEEGVQLKFGDGSSSESEN